MLYHFMLSSVGSKSPPWSTTATVKMFSLMGTALRATSSKVLTHSWKSGKPLMSLRPPFQLKLTLPAKSLMYAC